MHVQRTQSCASTKDRSYGILRVAATLTYVQYQVRALFQVQRNSYMGTEHHREGCQNE